MVVGDEATPQNIAAVIQECCILEQREHFLDCSWRRLHLHTQIVCMS
jgi:hypothetical protein